METHNSVARRGRCAARVREGDGVPAPDSEQAPKPYDDRFGVEKEDGKEGKGGEGGGRCEHFHSVVCTSRGIEWWKRFVPCRGHCGKTDAAGPVSPPVGV